MEARAVLSRGHIWSQWFHSSLFFEVILWPRANTEMIPHCTQSFGKNPGYNQSLFPELMLPHDGSSPPFYSWFVVFLLSCWNTVETTYIHWWSGINYFLLLLLMPVVHYASGTGRIELLQPHSGKLMMHGCSHLKCGENLLSKYKSCFIAQGIHCTDKPVDVCHIMTNVSC